MEKKSAGKKMQYEKPELLEIMKTGAEGAADCMEGTGASDCWSGPAAGNSCSIGTGDSPG